MSYHLIHPQNLLKKRKTQQMSMFTTNTSTVNTKMLLRQEAELSDFVWKLVMADVRREK